MQRRGFEGGSGRLIGRERDLEMLMDALAHAPAVVLIEGEAGVGKSRLLREACEMAAQLGIRVLCGWCHPLREPLAFGPVLDALRSIERDLPHPGSLSPQAGVLSAYLPQLAPSLPPPVEQPADARAARFQLMGALRSVLGTLGATMLVIEDVHWADQATRDLLLVLARDLPEGLRLVVTYRQEDLAQGQAVFGAPFTRPIGTELAELRLTPLTRKQVREMAAVALGPRASAELTAELYARSGGLPLVVEEDLAALATPDVQGTGMDDVARLRRTQVPRSLREAVEARLADLSPAALNVVQAAAVLAVPSPVALLEQMVSSTGAPITAGLGEALESGMLRESFTAHYGLRHALAQLAVYRAIAGPERERLHRVAIEILGARPDPPLNALAYHTRALGDVGAWADAAHAAAEQAVACGDDGTAATVLGEVMAEPELDPARRAATALLLARLAYRFTEHTTSVELLRTALTDPRLEPVTRGEIRLNLGLLLIDQAGDRSGLRELERAIDELRDDRPELTARAYGALAGHYENTPQQTHTWLERLTAALGENRDPVVHAQVQATRLSLMAKYADPAVWSEIEELPRHEVEREVLRQTTRALYNVGIFAIETGNDERGAALLSEALLLSRQVDWPLVECYAALYLLRCDYLAGRWQGLEGRFTALAAEFPDISAVAEEFSQLRADLALARGQWSLALDQARSNLQAHAGGSAPEAMGSVAVIGQVHLTAGDPHAAWTEIEPQLQIAHRAAIWARAGRLVPIAVQAALETGRIEAARDLVATVDSFLTGKDAPAAGAELRLARGLIDAHDQRSREAYTHFDTARLIFEAIGRPHHAARAIEHAARTRTESNAREAGRMLTRAASVYTGLGATADAARCQRALRAIGQARPNPRGQRSYGMALSPREAQVALLLSDGSSNMDIARALSLSPRTVEHHVANTLKKLGTTRSRLAHERQGANERATQGR